MTDLSLNELDSPMIGEKGERAAGIAAVATSASAAVACSACCVLPLALPAVALATAGGALAWMEVWHGWITNLSIALLLGGWGLVGWQSFGSGRRPARSTILLLAIATALTAVAMSWPLLEPALVTWLKD